MKFVNNQSNAKRRGFTLIEMIGVLAIIAVLAGLLLPRIFEAMNDSRINSAAMGYNSVKTAAMGYFGKYGRFGDATGVAIADVAAAPDWGKVLLSSGFLDKPFSTKIGSTASLVEIKAATTAATAVTGANTSYNFDDTGTANSIKGATLVIQVHLKGVDLADAQALSRRLDGDELSDLSATPATADLEGKVKYDFATTVGDVLLYVAHK
ncbi:MAG: hypothetical protein RIS76_3025 [Verrucomicrobiota bacterium]|jgi:prepilin-type N-terminal cleavage/methylation domain-containing protein